MNRLFKSKTHCEHILAMLLLLSACGGGGGDGGNNTPQPQSSRLAISVTQSEVMPADEVVATITGPTGTTIDSNSVELLADLGQGIVASVPFKSVSANQISFNAPMGIYLTSKLDIGSGAVKLIARPISSSSSVQSSDSVNLAVGSLNIPNTQPGNLSKAYLSATRELLLKSIGNYGLLDAKVVSLDEAKISAITQQLNQQISFLDEVISAIERAQAGESVTVGNLKEVPLTLTPESLPSLDRYNFSVFRIMPRPISPQISAKAAQAATDVADQFDIKGLADDMAQNAREIAERNRSVITTTLGVVAAGAVVMNAPTIAVAAGGLAAVTWFTTTAAGAAIGLALEAGSSSILDGQATVEDFKSTGEFVLDAYLEQAVSYVQGKALSGAFGDVWGSITGAGIDVASTTSEFMQVDVAEAFQSGGIPANGYAESSFSLTVLANFSGGGSYQVTVATSHSISGEIIQVQISGTDGFRYSQNVTTSNGVATISVPVGAAGVRDSINAYDVNGRAQAATTVAF